MFVLSFQNSIFGFLVKLLSVCCRFCCRFCCRCLRRWGFASSLLWHCPSSVMFSCLFVAVFAFVFVRCCICLGNCCCHCGYCLFSLFDLPWYPTLTLNLAWDGYVGNSRSLLCRPLYSGVWTAWKCPVSILLIPVQPVPNSVKLSRMLRLELWARVKEMDEQ